RSRRLANRVGRMGARNAGIVPGGGDPRRSAIWDARGPGLPPPGRRLHRKTGNPADAGDDRPGDPSAAGSHGTEPYSLSHPGGTGLGRRSGLQSPAQADRNGAEDFFQRRVGAAAAESSQRLRPIKRSSKTSSSQISIPRSAQYERVAASEKSESFVQS